MNPTSADRTRPRLAEHRRESHVRRPDAAEVPSPAMPPTLATALLIALAWITGWVLIRYVGVPALARRGAGDPIDGFFRVILTPAMRWLWRTDYVGWDAMPTRPGERGLILVCNHTAGIDPILVEYPLPFPVRWMMWEAMMIPAPRRSGDTGACCRSASRRATAASCATRFAIFDRVARSESSRRAASNDRRDTFARSSPASACSRRARAPTSHSSGSAAFPKRRARGPRSVVPPGRESS